nr:hypothetical protein [Tanacetum cinerariifolium]
MYLNQPESKGSTQEYPLDSVEVLRKIQYCKLEILSRRFFLKLNLPDHRSILTDSKMEVKVPDSSCLKDS